MGTDRKFAVSFVCNFESGLCVRSAAAYMAPDPLDFMHLESAGMEKRNKVEKEKPDKGKGNVTDRLQFRRSPREMIEKSRGPRYLNGGHGTASRFR